MDGEKSVLHKGREIANEMAHSPPAIARYRKPLRNAIGWSCYGLGMIIGNTVPIWAAWESYVAKASTEGFSQEVFDMQLNMLSSPWHMIGACAITVALALLGCLFGQRILRRHFQKAGIVK